MNIDGHSECVNDFIFEGRREFIDEIIYKLVSRHSRKIQSLSRENRGISGSICLVTLKYTSADFIDEFHPHWSDRQRENYFDHLLPDVNVGIFTISERKKFKNTLGDIYLNPSEIYGTGRHSTTQVCLMQALGAFKVEPPSRVLDVGCGSGILSIALAKRSTAKFECIDMDPMAVEIANANIKMNLLSNRIHAYTAKVGERPIDFSHYDLLVANLHMQNLVKLAKSISKTSKPSSIVFSGVTSKKVFCASGIFARIGYRVRSISHLNSYCAVHLSTAS